MHTLIAGLTRSGKSTLAKELGSSLRERGVECFALNPILEAGYCRRDARGLAAADWETDDAERFVAYVAARARAAPRARTLIVDEAHELFPRVGGRADFLWLARKGRHYGLTLILISQRAADLHPTARTQAGRLYLFRCSLTDADFLADQYGRPELREAIGLANGCFLRADPEGLTRGRVIL